MIGRNLPYPFLRGQPLKMFADSTTQCDLTENSQLSTRRARNAQATPERLPKKLDLKRVKHGQFCMCLCSTGR